MLAIPVGALIGSGVGVLPAVAVLLAGAGWTALYFVGFGALVGLVVAAVATAGGAVAALIVHRPRLAESGRSFVVLAVGAAAFLATFLFGVVVLGSRMQAGGPYLWGVAAVVLAVITWVCAGVLTSSYASTLLPRRARQARRIVG